VVLGQYPEDGLKLLQDRLPRFPDKDLNTICQPLDFYGANIYHGQAVRAAGDGGFELVMSDNPALTTMDWPVTPEALYWGPRFLFERYRLPVVTPENGMANCDWTPLDGMMHDPERIDLLRRYLRELDRAVEDGVDVKGYFLWSIMDNFEWAQGYKQRFGLIYVDFATRKRVLKDSAYWYKGVIASNGDLLTSP